MSNAKKTHPYGSPVWYSPSKGTYSPYRCNPDDENFDSLFEFEVFKATENLLKGKPYEVIRQVSTLLRFETDHYPVRRWKCDFCINRATHSYVVGDPLDGLLIEVKGLITREFKLEMEMLSDNNPTAFNRLWLIVTKKDRSLPIPQFTLSEYKTLLTKELNK
jgi:hypothetical protein